MTSTQTAQDAIEVRPLFAGSTACDVILNGVKVGEVFTNHMAVGASAYRFADQAAAVKAVISRHRTGSWTGEL